jgi:hypothetical protein
VRRLVIAVEPLLLGSSLAAVFGREFNVVLCHPEQEESCIAELAIVSESRRDSVKADTVITLPDVEGNAGTAIVWHGEHAVPVRIATLRDLVDVVVGVPA